MIRRMLLLMFLVCTSLSLYAQSAEDLEKIHKAHDVWGINRYSEAWNLLDEIDSELSPYWQARVLHLRGLIRQEEGNKKEAVGYFEQMEDFIEDSAGFSSTADGMALHALAITRQMYLKNVFYILDHLKRAFRLTEKALEMDPDNFTALVVLAHLKAKTPKLFGGDIDLALELLDKAMELEVNENAEKFSLYMTMIVTHSRNKTMSTAELYLEKALEIYPGSSMALRVSREEME